MGRFYYAGIYAWFLHQAAWQEARTAMILAMGVSTVNTAAVATPWTNTAVDPTTGLSAWQ